MTLLAAAVLVQGCATVDRGAIPVVDSGAPVSEEISARQARPAGVPSPAMRPQPSMQDSGVMVMIPPDNNAPLQTFPAPDAPLAGGIDTAPISQGGWNTEPAPSTLPPSQPTRAPTGIPSSGGLAADEQLDGPVLALLTTAQQQQGGGDLNGAASSLERAQRIAPREPQVLFRLAQVRLEQGDAVQAEQLSRRALSYASGRPALQASLWELIAQARERQGNAAGAAQARERARMTM